MHLINILYGQKYYYYSEQKKKYNNLPWIYKIRCCTMYIISHLSLLNVCFSSAAFGTMDLLLRLLKSNIYNVKTIRIKLHSLASWFFASFLSCCESLCRQYWLFLLKKTKNWIVSKGVIGTEQLCADLLLLILFQRCLTQKLMKITKFEDSFCTSCEE